MKGKTIKKLFTALISLLVVLTLMPANIFAATQYVLGEDIYIDKINIGISDKSGNYRYKAAYPKIGLSYDHSGDIIVETNNLPENFSDTVGLSNGARFEIDLAFSPADSGVDLTDADEVVYQLPSWLKPDAALSGEPVQDAAGFKIGEYELTTNGRVSIKFSKTYLDAYEGKITNCKLSINALLNSSETGTNIPAKIGEYEFNVPVKSIPTTTHCSANLTKSPVHNSSNKEKIQFDATTGKYYAEYTLKVTADSNNTETLDLSRLYVTDYYGGTTGSDYVEKTEIITAPSKGTALADQTIEFTQDNGTTIAREHGILWTFSEGETLANGKYVSLKYRVWFNEEFSKNPSVSLSANYAKLFMDDEKIAEKSVSTTFGGLVKLTKSAGNYYYGKDPSNTDTYGKICLDYSIKVEALNNNGTQLSGISVVDEFKKNGSYVEKVIITDTNGTSRYVDDSGKIHWEGLSFKNYLTLKYTVVLKDEAILQSSKTGESKLDIKNRATANAYGLTPYSEITTTIYKKWVVKGGTMQDNGTVKFVLKANDPSTKSNGSAKNNMMTETGELKIMDILGSGWLYCDKDGDSSGMLIAKRYTVTNGVQSLNKTIEIPLTTGAQDTEFGRFELKEVTEDGKTHQEFELDGTMNYYYELEYYAIPTPDNWGASISNEAGVGVGGSTTSYWHEYGYEGQGIKNVRIEKAGTGVNPNDNTCGWKLTVKNAIAQDMTIVDSRSDASKDTDGTFYMTDQQLADVKVTFEGEELDSSYYEVTANEGSNANHANAFTIKFLKDIDCEFNNPLTIEYRTTVEGLGDLEQNETIKYLNDAVISLGDQSAKATGENKFTRSTILTKQFLRVEYNSQDSDDPNSPTDAYVVWGLLVNENGTLEGNGSLKDTLPAGTEFVDYTVSYGASAEGKTTVSQPSLGTENGLQTVTFNFTDLQKTEDPFASIWIEITTKITDSSLLMSNVETNLVNNATFTSPAGSADATDTAKITVSTLEKSASYFGKDDGKVMHFTIVVNREGIDMIPGSANDAQKYVKVVDAMSDNVDLLPKTIVVKDKNGTVVFNGATEESNDVFKNVVKTEDGFTFDILDGGKYTVTYDVQFKGKPGEQVKVTNKVSYFGYPGGSSTENNETIYKADATADGKPYFYIVKLDKEATTTTIDGAKFALYEVHAVFETNPETGEEEFKEVEYKQVGPTKTTGTVTNASTNQQMTGAVKFDNLEKGVVYAYKELETVEGYYLTEEAKEYQYFVFTIIDEDTHENVTQVELEKTGLPQDIIEMVASRQVNTGASFQAYNDPTVITVEKSFEGYTADGVYYFGLFDSESAKTPIVKDGVPTVAQMIVQNGKVTSKAKFTKVKDGTYYVYEVDEQGNKLAEGESLVVDDVKYIVSGGGVATIKVNDTDQVVPSATVSVTNTAVSSLKINKVLVGNESGTFYFTVKGADGLYYDQTGKTSADEKRVSLTYSADGENSLLFENLPIQKYTVEEVGDTMADYKVTYKSSSTVEVKAKTVAEVTVTNTLKTGDLKVTKAVQNNEGTEDKFTFTITLSKNNVPVSGTFSGVEFNANGVATIELGDGESKEIKGLPVGTSYTVEEAEAEGYTTIASGEVGVIVADDVVTAAFTNKYTAKPTEVQFSGTKTLEGFPEGFDVPTFEFTLSENDKVIDTKTTTGSGEFQFKKISYSEPGTHTYVAKETKGNAGGIKYDETEYTITVVVEDNHKGQLVATISGIEADGSGLDFVNPYDTEPTSVQFSGKKTFIGPFPTDKDTPVFTFVLTEDGVTLDSKTVTGTGEFKFKAIDYKTTGNHTYVVSETKGDNPGITYDTKTYTILVEVTDDGAGNLVATIKSGANKDGSGLDFTNTYETKPTKVQFSGLKQLDGRPLNDKEFTFTLSGTGTALTAQNNGNGLYTFPEIEYTSAGTYNYTVTEETGNLKGVKYDSTVYNVTVEVEDDGLGQLHATSTAKNGETVVEVTALNFKNEYKPSSASVTLGGHKTLTGYPEGVTPPTFEFTLSENDTVIDTKTVVGTGDYKFDSITYDTTGVHNYVVKETVGDANGVTYDKTEYEFTVTVTDDNKGSLLVAITGDTTTGTDLDFENPYSPDPVTIQFYASKEFTGFPYETDNLPKMAGEKNGAIADPTPTFEFELKDEAGKVIETVNITGGGSFHFNEIEYTEVGTHKYTVSEKNTGHGGVTYDETVYEVTVEVYDDGTGQLKTRTSDNFEGISFINTYESAPTSVTFEGSKYLEGRDLTENEFTFQLVDAEGNVIEEVTNNADGEIIFSEIEYPYGSDGVYEYDVFEVNDEEHGMVYDETIYHLIVTVVDDLNGQMVATISGDSTTGKDLTFENEFEWGSLSIEKRVSGNNASKKKMFTFLVEFDFDGETLEGLYAYTGSYTGFIKSGDTIELKHGDKITIVGLPKGAHFVVTEDKASAKGYKIKMENGEGIIEKDVTIEALCRNIRNIDYDNPDDPPYDVPDTATK